MYARRYRRGFGRRKLGVAKKALWRKPTARAQRGQIYSLAKSVGKLKHKWTERTVTHSYRQTANISLLSTLFPGGAGYVGVKLTQPVDWKSIFAETNAQGETNKTLLSEIQLHLRFTITTAIAPTVYHCFVVSLRRAAGTLNISGLTNDVHFMTQPAGNPECCYSVILNPKLFRIHRQRKFTLAINSEGANQLANPTDGFPPCSWKDINWVLKPKCTLKSYQGEWSALQELDLPTTQRYYLLVFMSNSGTDAQNNCSMTNLIKCKNMY